MRKTLFRTLPILATIAMIGCQPSQPKDIVRKVSNTPSPEWTKNSVIYEVNIRQYTPEGTFAAFENHLPRLKEMGVDILWVMPIHPIGIKNHKGTLGSYYSISDYKAVNPEYGTMDDFKRLVNKSHELGMKVIIDWVANHTAWDNVWVNEHPEWYKKNDKGEIDSYAYDNGREIEYWTDVVGLDYNQPAVREAMIDAMKFWIQNADIDGYRCDVAGLVPSDFWEQARKELDAVKPIFMLAENEDQTPLLMNAFNANYSWSMKEVVNQIAKGEKTALDIADWMTHNDTIYPTGTYGMLFTSNHDENSWHGSEYERLGDAVKPLAVLSFTAPGMPLIYSGQEAGVSKRIRFFDKDTIVWDNLEMADFYKKLTTLKKSNPALANGSFGGKTELIATSQPSKIVAFSRQTGNNQVIVLINVSVDTVHFTLDDESKGIFNDYFNNTEVELPLDKLTMLPLEYRVYTK